MPHLPHFGQNNIYFFQNKGIVTFLPLLNPKKRYQKKVINQSREKALQMNGGWASGCIDRAKFIGPSSIVRGPQNETMYHNPILISIKILKKMIKRKR